MREQAAQEAGDDKDEDDEGDGHKGSFQFTVRAAIQAVLAEGNRLAEPHDGVRQSLGVA